MICEVLHNVDDSKALKLKGFSDIKLAKEWMDENTKTNYIQNARIIVDYSAIEAFQEMYELMKERVFSNTSYKTMI